MTLRTPFARYLFSAIFVSQLTFAAAADKAETPAPAGVDRSAMDSAVRPQDDFYRYANGLWLHNTDIPSARSEYSIFSQVYTKTQQDLRSLIHEAARMLPAAEPGSKRLGALYRSFMNVERINALGMRPLREELKSIAAITTHREAARVMGQLYLLGVQMPLGLFVYPDAKASQRYALWLTQSGLLLPGREYYLRHEEKFKNHRDEAVQYMADLLALSGNQHPELAAKAIMKLEMRLAQVQSSGAMSREVEQNYHKVTALELSRLLKGFDWYAFTTSMGAGRLTSLIVRQMPFFAAFGDLFQSTDLAVWRDYLTVRLLDKYAPYLPQQVVNRHFAFHQTAILGITNQVGREHRAVKLTNEMLGPLLGQQYVQRHFNPQAKVRAQAMVSNLLKAYRESIGLSTWMTSATKQAAMTKLAALKVKIGYPAQWRDFSALQLSQRGLVKNYKAYSRFESAYYLAKVGQPVLDTDWAVAPQTVNARYSPTRNEVVLPAALLQAPFFAPHHDAAANYGAIGAIIAHEIAHAFDDQGARYDASGNLRNWWQEADREAFGQRIEALVLQFNALKPFPDQHVDGQLTLGENLADLAGVNIAYRAYQMTLSEAGSETLEGLTGEQRFFIAYAQTLRAKVREQTLRNRLLSDTHAPNKYRVNSILRHVEGFYQAFGLKAGDKMFLEPQARVTIW